MNSGLLVALTLLVGALLTWLLWRQRTRAARNAATRPLVFRGGADDAKEAALPSVTIPGYRVFARVGGGGMANVYRARRERDGVEVALKLPHDAYLADDAFIRRFDEEAALVARFDHPNIARLIEHGSVGMHPFMAFEYVDGESLEAMLERRAFTLPRLLDVMVQLSAALAHIHSRGVVHRDIKPANVMVRTQALPSASDMEPLAGDAVKLMDFGIAAGRAQAPHTAVGHRVGTPVYMAPEQARGLALDHRADIYSLGLVFYELLTGQPAFRGASDVVVHQQIFQMPPPPKALNAAVSDALDALVMRMIAKEPSARPSLLEVQAVLATATQPDGALAQSEAERAMRLVVAVQARQAVVRALDTQGNQVWSWGDVGAGERAFVAAPAAVALDRSGHLYAIALHHHGGDARTPRITRRAPDGRVVAEFETTGDATQLLRYPVAIACAPDGSVLVLDAQTHMLLRYSAAGAFIQAFGGRGVGRGRFDDPRSVQVDANGRVYVLDYGNRQVQRLHADGSFDTRWAFRASASDDGQRRLDGFHVDARGNLYISDAQTLKVRMLDANGHVGTVFSLPTEARGREALLELTTDARGGLYSVRRGDGLIRKHRPDGSLAGTLMAGAPVQQMLGVAGPVER